MRLNLGSGHHPLAGYLNVDRTGEPDLRWDLEHVPWPWPTSSVDEVVLCHVLEHLGATPDAYFAVIRELYRVCAGGATVAITVPHPRHDDFLADPTHVRAITPAGLQLLSQAANRAWLAAGDRRTPLGLDLGVDFELVSTHYAIDELWSKLAPDDIADAVRRYNNVVKEIRMTLRVIKSAPP